MTFLYFPRLFRARRRIIEDAMSEDSGMSDDNVATGGDGEEQNPNAPPQELVDVRDESVVRGSFVFD